MLKEELKKIWRPGMAVVFIITGFIFYTMSLEFYIEYFPGGPQYEGIFEVARQLVETYGTSLSEDEMAEFESGIPLLRKEADQYVAESEIGKKYGLKTYEQYGKFQQKVYEKVSQSAVTADQNENYADFMRLENYLQGEGTDNIEGRLYASCLFAEQYHFEQELKAVRPQKGQMWQNILPWEVPQATGAYMGRLLIWICLSVCMLLSPLTVYDRMAQMRPLQCSSRHGRNIYRSQLAAVLLSAFLLVTINLVLFGGLFAMHGTFVFLHCKMDSFMSLYSCWPDWTHGTWCLMLALMCYLIAIGTAGIVFFLTQKCTNYIGMMLMIVPLFAGVSILCPKVIENAFYDLNDLYRYTGVPYIELICAAAVFTAGMVLCWLGSRKAKKEAI